MDYTMQDFFQAYVLPLLDESQDEDSYEEFWLANGNIVLQECWDINNQVRNKKGLEEFEGVYTILDADDTIPYEQEVMLMCAVYGWAASLIVDDTNDDGVNKWTILHDAYERGKKQLGRFMFCRVVTEYAG